ncbi:TRAP-type transport system, small permease component, predicted N-acetylneuraminate transporter [uncultured Candidatus Thioglobus sp.]|nr:TRAP-type transport system, small permease component, predicted N-acetylneuraminate transporter [uncultured Candidatus Thioglobus sp.]
MKRRHSIFDEIEEIAIALCLATMVLLTFANVIVRYFFNDNIIWALELTLFLFAWFVLLGMSYGIKKNFHIGVDFIINTVSKRHKKILALLSVSLCLLFSIMLSISAWQYWYPFITERAFLEVDDIPMPELLQFLALFNAGEDYEKLPLFIPYAALPIGAFLLTYRLIQQFFLIVNNQSDAIIANHLDIKVNQ